MCNRWQRLTLPYLSLVNSDPVAVRKPLVSLDVCDAVFQIAETFRQVDLQLITQKVFDFGAEVRRKPHLNESRQ